MKILKIAFTNINSLRGEHEIDFTEEPFISSSLFAITGQTGSGKSTILDVISLALFNQVPRLGKISKNEILAKGAILTRNQKEAIARITYECKLGIFSSQWSISTNRNDNLRDYEMEIFDHHKNELIDLKKSDVPSKNEELIGLSYDQFIKAVLLAQGEFAQFLKVTKKERGALLEKITGTGIYRAIGQKVYEKNGLLNKDIEQQQNEIKIIQAKLLEDEDLNSKKADFESKNRAIENFQKEIERLKKLLLLKESIQDKTNRIKQINDDKSAANKQLDVFEKEHGAPLKQHEKVQDYSEELRSWNLLGKEISHLTSELVEVKENQKENSEKISKIISEVSTLTNSVTSSENITENLSGFRKKILKLQEQRREKQTDYKLERTKLLSEIDQTDLSLNDSNLVETQKEIETKIGETRESLKKWNVDFEVNDTHEIQNLRATLQKEYRTTREASREFAAIEDIQKDLSRNSSDFEKLQPQLKALPIEIEKQKIQIQSEQKSLENLNLRRENALLKASLEQHRHKLKDGEACPLCGALNHPYAEHLPEKDDQLDTEIAKVQQRLEEQTARLSSFIANHDSYKKQAGELEENNRTFSKNLLRLKTDFKEKFSEITEAQNLKDLENRCDVLETKIEELNKFEKGQQKLQHLQNALPIIEKLRNILLAGKQLKEKLDGLYTGNDIQQEVEHFQNRWMGLKSDQKNLKIAQEKLQKQKETKQNELQNLEKELKPKLEEKEFEGVAAGFEALMQEYEVNRLRGERQKIQKKIDDTHASLKILIEQLEDLKKLNTDSKEEEVREKLKLKNEECESITKDCKEIDRLITNHNENVSRMKHLQQEIAEKEKQTRRWRMLNELIGDRTGNKFNDFAQDLTLSRLIKLANIRLKDLSDRYLIDKPKEEEDDGLVAIDEHMGGQRRSVKTLSGGETFLLSLSMALALSDLASKNVEINSLFIDEGFGTLDPETLDQTLDTLEKLQSESSKTIGIISHVDSLKERIFTQIKLTRNGQGYSSLEIQ